MGRRGTAQFVPAPSKRHRCLRLERDFLLNQSVGCRRIDTHQDLANAPGGSAGAEVLSARANQVLEAAHLPDLALVLSVPSWARVMLAGAYRWVVVAHWSVRAGGRAIAPPLVGIGLAAQTQRSRQAAQ